MCVQMQGVSQLMEQRIADREEGSMVKAGGGSAAQGGRTHGGSPGKRLPLKQTSSGTPKREGERGTGKESPSARSPLAQQLSLAVGPVNEGSVVSVWGDRRGGEQAKKEGLSWTPVLTDLDASVLLQTEAETSSERWGGGQGEGAAGRERENGRGSEESEGSLWGNGGGASGVTRPEIGERGELSVGLKACGYNKNRKAQFSALKGSRQRVSG